MSLEHSTPDRRPIFPLRIEPMLPVPGREPSFMVVKWDGLKHRPRGELRKWLRLHRKEAAA